MCARTDVRTRRSTHSCCTAGETAVSFVIERDNPGIARAELPSNSRHGTKQNVAVRPEQQPCLSQVDTHTVSVCCSKRAGWKKKRSPPAGSASPSDVCFASTRSLDGCHRRGNDDAVNCRSTSLMKVRARRQATMNGFHDLRNRHRPEERWGCDSAGASACYRRESDGRRRREKVAMPEAGM